LKIPILFSPEIHDAESFKTLVLSVLNLGMIVRFISCYPLARRLRRISSRAVESRVVCDFLITRSSISTTSARVGISNSPILCRGAGNRLACQDRVSTGIPAIKPFSSWYLSELATDANTFARLLDALASTSSDFRFADRAIAKEETKMAEKTNVTIQ
jgi:hypothetical protein